MLGRLAERLRHLTDAAERVAVVPEAWKFALPLFLLAVPALLYPPAAVGLLALAAGVLLFFRDPERSPPPSGIVSPADGTVSVVRTERIDGDERVRVGVFMNVTDVHVNRAPADAVVETVEHRPGAHRPAFSKDSERNERVDVDCGDYVVSQIAGAFARRITPYVDEGDHLARGERIGHIAFGSRADVLLPAGIDVDDLHVETGQTVRAGETVVAERSE